MDLSGASTSSAKTKPTPAPLSPPSARTDGAITLTPTTLTSPGYMISPKVEQSDWKITIENSDGSTSEVDLFRREIKISMRGDNSMKNSTKQPDIENQDPPKDESKFRNERMWVLGQHILTTSAALAVIAISILTLRIYAKTKHTNDDLAMLSPTVLMLSMSCLTVAADVILVYIYHQHHRHGRPAATAERMIQKVRGATGILQAISGAISAGYFKSSKNDKGSADLWTWACSDGKGTLNNSSTLCPSNQAAWILNLLQVTVHTLSFALVLWNLFFNKTTAKEFLDLLEKPNKDEMKMDETLHVKSSLAGSN